MPEQASSGLFLAASACGQQLGADGVKPEVTAGPPVPASAWFWSRHSEMIHNMKRFFGFLFVAGALFAQTDYDLLLKGGHVIDGKNRLSSIRDVAIKDGKIAAVAANIAAARALKTVDVCGLYVTPGLVDIHVHVYPGLVKNSYSAATGASSRTASRCASV